jgi:hypothetical protein
MKKALLKTILVFISILSICSPSKAFSSDSTFENITSKVRTLERIDLMEVYVKSRKVVISQTEKDGTTVTRAYRVATATPKNAEKIPFGKTGKIFRVTRNPPYVPTKDHILAEKKKGKVCPEKIMPGDPKNPLGKLKLYFAFSGCDPSLSIGGHCTIDQSSIGKQASEGCVRFKDEDAFEIGKILLNQNGLDAEEIFKLADENPFVSYPYKLKIQPNVVFYNK